MNHILRFSCAALVLLAACGGSPHTSSFPTRSELDALAAAPLPPRLGDDKAIETDTWELRGTLPDALDEATGDDAGPWAKLLAETAAGRPNMLVSRAMACAARETAAFVVEKGALGIQSSRHCRNRRLAMASFGNRLRLLSRPNSVRCSAPKSLMWSWRSGVGRSYGGTTRFRGFLAEPRISCSGRPMPAFWS